MFYSLILAIECHAFYGTATLNTTKTNSLKPCTKPRANEQHGLSSGTVELRDSTRAHDMPS